MKAIPRLLHPFRVPALLAACLLFACLLQARPEPEPSPTIWPLAGQHQIVTSPAVERVLTQDELWNAGTPRHQILDTGGATRTVTLAPVGPGGIPAGTRYVARVSTRGEDRILFRRSDGELLAFWGSDASPQTQWVVLTATSDGWDTRISAGTSLAHEDARLSFLGADLQAHDGFVQPASPRASGYAIRFETDAALIYVACRANHPRFRVVVNGEVIAGIEIDSTSGLRLHVPVDLGGTASKQVEILADNLEFASVETTDARTHLAAWREAPAARMVWIGDASVEIGTHAHPWLAARLLNYEVWSLSWGDGAQRVAGADRSLPPLAAIEEDITAADPDVVVLNGDFFDEQLPPKEYAAVVGAWFDAIAQASRPEVIKIVLPSMRSAPEDRMARRRAAIVSKEARRRDFHFMDCEDWVEDERDTGPQDDERQIVSENGVHYTPFGSAFIAGRFAEQVRRADLERKIQLASVKRLQAEDATPSIAAAEQRR
ncbi:MAG: hypothetical protein ACREIA_18460 [Opitutaceae bacterium]